MYIKAEHFVVEGTENRKISEVDRIQFEKFLDMLISSQACKGRFNDYSMSRGTLQAIGSGNAEIPEMECDIV